MTKKEKYQAAIVEFLGLLGPMRFTDLKEALPNSDRGATIHKALTELAQLGKVTRTRHRSGIFYTLNQGEQS